MFVIYEGNGEVIVTTQEGEAKMLQKITSLMVSGPRRSMTEQRAMKWLLGLRRRSTCVGEVCTPEAGLRVVNGNILSAVSNHNQPASLGALAGWSG